MTWIYLQTIKLHLEFFRSFGSVHFEGPSARQVRKPLPLLLPLPLLHLRLSRPLVHHLSRFESNQHHVELSTVLTPSFLPRRSSSVCRASFKGPSLVQLVWLTWVQIPAPRYKGVLKIIPSCAIRQTTLELSARIRNVTFWRNGTSILMAGPREKSYCCKILNFLLH